jgi:hypothetical protein
MGPAEHLVRVICRKSQAPRQFKKRDVNVQTVWVKKNAIKLALKHWSHTFPKVSPLFRGLYSRVANDLGFDASCVSRVARGERRSEIIEEVI